jgi:hypothetical protein
MQKKIAASAAIFLCHFWKNKMPAHGWHST